MRFAAVFLLLVVGAGCVDPPVAPPSDDPVDLQRDAGTDDNSCDDDFDCPFGEECVEGACTEIQSVVGDEGCTVDADCDEGFSCALTTGQCIPDAAIPPPVTGPPGP